MKRQVHSRIKIYFLLVLTFSFCVFGCGEKEEKEMQAGKVKAKQLMDKNITFASKDSADENATPEMNTSHAVHINDQIQMEQWKQLLEDLKSALGNIKEGTEQAR